MEKTLREVYRIEKKLSSHAMLLLHMKNTVSQCKYEEFLARDTYARYLESIRGVFDKIRGKYSGKEEAILKKIRDAESRIQTAQQQLRAEEQKHRELEEQRSALPTREDLRRAAEKDSGLLRLWAQLEVDYCLIHLNGYLPSLREALEVKRDVMQGREPGAIRTPEQREAMLARADEIAKKVLALMLRTKDALQILEEPFEITAYFQNPVGYIEGMASRFNRVDRVNLAMDQISAAHKRVKELMTKYSIE